MFEKLKSKKIFCIFFFVLFCSFGDYIIQKENFKNKYKFCKDEEKVEYEINGRHYKIHSFVVYKKREVKKYSLFNILPLSFELERFKPISRSISTIEFKNGDKIKYIDYGKDVNDIYNSSAEKREEELKNEPAGDSLIRKEDSVLRNSLISYSIVGIDHNSIMTSDSILIEKANHHYLKKPNIEHYVNINGIWKIDYIYKTTDESAYVRRGSRAIETFFENDREIKTVYFDEETYSVKEEYHYKDGRMIEGYKYNIFGNIIEVY